jgi:hypothetical protein
VPSPPATPKTTAPRCPGQRDVGIDISRTPLKPRSIQLALQRSTPRTGGLSELSPATPAALVMRLFDRAHGGGQEATPAGNNRTGQRREADGHHRDASELPDNREHRQTPLAVQQPAPARPMLGTLAIGNRMGSAPCCCQTFSRLLERRLFSQRPRKKGVKIGPLGVKKP